MDGMDTFCSVQAHPAAVRVARELLELLGPARDSTGVDAGGPDADLLARATLRLARLRPRELQALPALLRAEREALTGAGAHRKAELVRRLRCEVESRLSILRDMLA
jgi:hypothetical protein